MPAPTPAEAEAHLRRLLAKHGLPPPDEVRHRVGEVVLVYERQRYAFVFELSGPWPEDDDEAVPHAQLHVWGPDEQAAGPDEHAAGPDDAAA